LIAAHSPITDSAHAAQQLAQPLQQLALYLETHAASVFPSAEDRAEAERILGDDTRPLVAIHPGSGSPRKNWPVERWASLGAELLARDPQSRLLLIGGEADHAQLDKLQGEWPRDSVLIARDLPLPHLAAVLERCALFLGHDSGISHLAAAVGARCVLLFGPTDPAIWAPANANVTVLTAPESDLAQLSVERVLLGLR
jgi:heptosyltransferase-2